MLLNSGWQESASFVLSQLVTVWVVK